MTELDALRALAAAVRAWADPASDDEDGACTDAVYDALANVTRAASEETP